MKATKNQFRILIRNILKENIEAQSTEEKPLLDEKPKEVIQSEDKEIILGDPLTDIKLNTTVGNLGSDGKIAPALSVKAGSGKLTTKTGSAQKKPTFSKETPKAPLKKESSKSWEPNKKIFEKRKEEREAIKKGTRL